MFYQQLLCFCLILYSGGLFGEENCLVLNLENALSRALNCNRQIFNSIDAKIKAEYNIVLAQSEFDLKILPNSRAGYTGGGHEGQGASAGVGFDLFKQFTTGTTVRVGPSFLKTPEHYHTCINAMVSHPLLSGFDSEYQLDSLRGAEFSLRSAARSLYNAQIQLVLRTIQSLYEVIKTQKGVELNQASHDRIKKFFQTAKLKEKIGMSDALDVYRAEIELNQAEDALTTSHERLLEVQDNLRDLLALPLDLCIKVDLPIIYTENEMTEEEAIQLAYRNRMEMEQAEDQWRETRRLSENSKVDIFPDLNLVLDYTNTALGEIFTDCWGRRENKWGIGVTANGDINPIGDELAYKTSLIAVNASERGMEQTKASLALEVKKNLRQLARAKERIHLQSEQIKTAEGQLYLSQIKFARGMANNFDVIQAEKSLRGAQLAYWSALIEHIVGEYQFLATIGLLSDKPCIEK